MNMAESLYDIPPGCICLGDGLFGMKCEADSHARLKETNMADVRKMTTDLLIDHLTDFAGTDEGDELRRRLKIMWAVCDAVKGAEFIFADFRTEARLESALKEFITMEAESEATK